VKRVILDPQVLKVCPVKQVPRVIKAIAVIPVLKD
jgi:hypothetical protein